MTEEGIRQKNEQFKRLQESRNGAQMFYLSTKDKTGRWHCRMESTDVEVLKKTGKNWLDGKFCQDYQITHYKVGKS